MKIKLAIGAFAAAILLSACGASDNTTVESGPAPTESHDTTNTPATETTPSTETPAEGTVPTTETTPSDATGTTTEQAPATTPPQG
jgi:hypothetical protein